MERSVKESTPFGDHPRAKRLTDFYPSWYATRELFLRHRNPYGIVVNRDLQIAYYDYEPEPFVPEKGRDLQRFVYPLYFVFFIAPLVRMDFQSARIIFGLQLDTCAVLSMAFWLWFIRPRLSWFAVTGLFILFLTSIPVLQNLSILQPFLLPACLIAAAAVAVLSERLFLCGLLLALATVKPQLCILPLAWFALWLSGNWKQRFPLFWGFTTTLAALLVASTWLLPDWLIQYPSVVRAYAEYTQTTSLLGTLLPNPWHWPFTVLAVLMSARFCWRVRRQPADSAPFAIALSLVLVLTVLIIPAMVQPFNYILLLPAVLLVIRYWQELQHGNPRTRYTAYLFSLCAFLPWLMAAVAVANPLDRNRDWLLKTWSLPVATQLALPMGAFAVLIVLSNLALPPSLLFNDGRPLQPAGIAADIGRP
jgi:Glycosyltransferase family 87